MRDDKIAQFLSLQGQNIPEKFDPSTAEKRKLGAQLLLSEVLEYVVEGLGVTPVVNGTPITEPDYLEYQYTKEPNECEMLDGLADVAYTMYWNSLAFGLPLEHAFELVCDNNLEKFVKLENYHGLGGKLERSEWHCEKDTSWPKEVETVEVIKIQGEHYAVGKDGQGKVRKPSNYKSVNLSPLCGV